VRVGKWGCGSDRSLTPESILKKNSNSISYHAVRESSAMGESITGHAPSVDSPHDICIKVVPGGQNQHHLIHLLSHDLCDLFVCLIILLAEEVCGYWGVPCCMGN
jgi:hypothetical protein